jgi:hypothetical protein
MNCQQKYSMIVSARPRGLENPVAIVHSLPNVPALLRKRHGVSVSYQTLWGYCVRGDLPAERNGRAWAIRDQDIASIAAAVSALLAVPSARRRAQG